jgi:putative ABC transport system substrate-binding protein
MISLKILPSRTGNYPLKSLLLTLLVIGVLLPSGCAGKTPKIHKVGILSGTNAYVIVGDSFIKVMTEMGYVEGKNIFYDFQKANADPAAEESAIKKFIADNVDLVFTITTGTTINAKKFVKDTSIPLIFAIVTVEGSGLVENSRHPGGNITGVRTPGADVTLKRLEILLEIAPKLKRLWTPYKKNYPPVVDALEKLLPAAEAAHVEIIQAPAEKISEWKTDLDARDRLRDPGVDAILIMPDIFSQSPDAWALISGFAARHKLPIAGNSSATVRQGAVFTFSADYVESGELAAVLADKIFKGTPAGTIPLITPEPRLRINYRTADELGLEINQGLLKMATEIIR